MVLTQSPEEKHANIFYLHIEFYLEVDFLLEVLSGGYLEVFSGYLEVELAQASFSLARVGRHEQEQESG